MAVQNAGCVFAYFCGGHKNKFMAPLNIKIILLLETKKKCSEQFKTPMESLNKVSSIRKKKQPSLFKIKEKNKLTPLINNSLGWKKIFTRFINNSSSQ